MMRKLVSALAYLFRLTDIFSVFSDDASISTSSSLSIFTYTLPIKRIKLVQSADHRLFPWCAQANELKHHPYTLNMSVGRNKRRKVF